VNRWEELNMPATASYNVASRRRRVGGLVASIWDADDGEMPCGTPRERDREVMAGVSGVTG
jgi:hypothetical protein